MIGTDLSHFKITAKLGEGGMGEVYRAEDSKLGREVAIKVLPEAVASDPERLARFEREAKILGSLNHPNIAAIHQVEEAEGIHFLVMELVEGEDLHQVISRGAVPVEESLAIALQIAKALEAAHSRGIVHRDLKPANVMITTDKRAKVLDFGLAKAVQAPSSDNTPLLSQSPTLTAQMTQAGTLLGTAAYMSPEQARGHDVNHLADIWAFGVVLFELLTGQRGFDGPTATDVLAAVLTREPDWDRLPADLPPSVRRLLRRCLTHDPRERLQSIADARLEIRDAANESLETGSPPESRRIELGVLVAAVCLSLLVGALGANWWFSSQTVTGYQAQAPIAQFTIDLPLEQQITILGDDFQMALSPDGKRLAWKGGAGANRNIFIRELDGLENRALEGAGSTGMMEVKFSPDGTRLASGSARRELYRFAVEGGVPARIFASDSNIWYFEWETDDSIILSLSHSGLKRLTINSGKVEQVTQLDIEKGEVAHERVRRLPDGKGLLFSVGIGNFHDCHIEVFSFASGTRHTVIKDASVAEYVDSGHLVFARDGTVFAAPFDLETLQVTGAEVPLLAGVQMDPSSRRVAQMGISFNGTLAYFPERELGQQRLVWIDRQGAREEIAIEAPLISRIDLSPNGNEVALISPRGHSFQIYRYDLSRDVLSRITTQGSNNGSPIWSPDGDRLAFSSNRNGQWNLFLTSRNRDDAHQLKESPNIQRPSDWSADGQVLAFEDRTATDDFDLWLLPMDGEKATPRPIATGQGDQSQGRFSPDGKLLAFVWVVDGRPEIFIAEVADDTDVKTERHLRVSTAGGKNPVWSPGGGELLYLSLDGTRLLSVPIANRPQAQFGKEQTTLSGLPKTPYDRNDRAFEISPDGKRFLFLFPEEQPETQEVVVITDWRDTLRQATQ